MTCLYVTVKKSKREIATSHGDQNKSRSRQLESFKHRLTCVVVVIDRLCNILMLASLESGQTDACRLCFTNNCVNNVSALLYV